MQKHPHSCRVQQISIFLGVALCLSLPCMAQFGRVQSTGYVRELAKNKTHLYLIASGPDTMALARTIQDQIQASSDNRHKPDEIVVATIEEAARATTSDPKFDAATHLFLLTYDEMKDALSAALAKSFPLRADLDMAHVSVVRSMMTHPADKGLAFNIALVGPDKRFVEMLWKALEAKRFDNWRAMPFSQEFPSSRIAAFTSEPDHAAIQSWGLSRDHLNAVTWYTLAEREGMPPARLNGWHEVYFINRGHDRAALPAPAAQVLEGHELGETTCFIGRKEHAGHTTAVFSMPNPILLTSCAKRYPSLIAIPDTPVVRDVTDLRHIGVTTLIVHSANLSKGTAEQIRSQLATDMRRQLRIDVQERGPSLKAIEDELTLEQLTGATDTADKLRRSVGLHYLWIFDMTDCSGSCAYRGEERCLGQDPGPFSEPEPQKPDRQKPFWGGRKPQDQYDREVQEYNRQHAEWGSRAQQYEAARLNASVPWERAIYATSTARSHGILRLYDLRVGVGKVVWEKECDGQAEDSKQFNSDRVSVRGYANRPNSMETPATSEQCPLSLLLAAAHKAGNVGIETLQAEAWLPDGTLPPQPKPIDESTGNTTANDNDHTTDSKETNVDSAQPRIADVSGSTVTLTVGKQQGVKVGDLVVVPLETKTIKDPATGKVLETRMISKVTLRVKTVSVTADCEPLNMHEAAKMAQVKPNMTVTISHPSAPPPPTGKGKRTTKKG